MVTQVLRRLGYRHTLVGITLDYWANDRSVLFAITSNGDMDADLPLFILGMAMSTQFTAMNTHHTPI